MATVSGVYYWRARTEERHLMTDPVYREYTDWMDRNGPLPRLLSWITGRKKGAVGALQPAEYQVPIRKSLPHRRRGGRPTRGHANAQAADANAEERQGGKEWGRT